MHIYLYLIDEKLEDRWLILFYSVKSPMFYTSVSIYFQSGSLWAWWSWGLFSSFSWWGSAGASVALIAAVVMSAAPAVRIPAAVHGHVSDCLPKWAKPWCSLLLSLFWKIKLFLNYLKKLLIGSEVVSWTQTKLAISSNASYWLQAPSLLL